MTVGERIAKRRKELNMTMQDVADYLGVQRSVVNKYEKDRVDMKISTIRALHTLLGLSYLELLDDDDSEDLEVITAYNNANSDKQETVRATLRLPEKK